MAIGLYVQTLCKVADDPCLNFTEVNGTMCEAETRAIHIKDIHGDLDDQSEMRFLKFADHGDLYCALSQLGLIAALSAWKQSCRNAGSLDVMDLVCRTTPIESSLVVILTELYVKKAVTPATSASNALHLLTW